LHVFFIYTNLKIGRPEGIILVHVGLGRWAFSFSPV
jgi:hypothetical protein